MNPPEPDTWPPVRPWPEMDVELPPGPLWVFAYGSLMWNPGLPRSESCRARLHGYHRAFCVRSVVYRGTEAQPGLVLGLDRGGSCMGVAHRVAADDAPAGAAYLYRREMVTRVYRQVFKQVRLLDGRTVPAMTFVVRRAHAQYAGRLAPEEVARVARRARGQNGANAEYVTNTLAHVHESGISCSMLQRVREALMTGPR